MHYIVRNEIAYPYPNVDGCIVVFFFEKNEWFCGAPPNNEMAMIHIKMYMWNLKLCETH